MHQHQPTVANRVAFFFCCRLKLAASATPPQESRGGSGWLGKHGLRLLITITLQIGFSQNLFSQTTTRARSPRDGVMDQLKLRDGTTLLGLAVTETPPRLLVRTAWLKAKSPTLLTNRVLPEVKHQGELRNRFLREFLQQERVRLELTTPESQQRASLLKELEERLNPEDPPLPRWILFQAAREQFRRGELQPVQRREVCRMALSYGIPDLEEREWKSVVQEIRLQQAPPSILLPDISTASDTPSMEHLRDQILAAVDVRLNTVTRLIQSGPVFLDEQQRPDPAALIQMALNQNLEGTLQELLNEVGGAPSSTASSTQPSLDKAFQLAERRSHRTLIISNLQMQPSAGQATVSQSLYFRDADQQWKLLFEVIGKGSAANVDPAQIQPLENDPQIQQIVTVMQGLGINENQLQVAFRMGAVVQAAQNSAATALASRIQDLLTARWDAGDALVRIQDAP